MHTRYKERQIVKIKVLIIGVLVCLLAVGVYGCKKGKETIQQDIEEDLSTWTGTYTYGATFPHAIEAEFNYFIGYTVAVYEEKGEYYANITANGWQLCSASLARVEGNKDAIDFLFVETLPKDSRYGKSERYEKGEVMLSFTRKEEHIETIWGTLRKEHPVFIESEEELVGDYFVKATDNVLMETYITSESKVEAASGPLPTLAPTYNPTPVKGSPTPRPTPTLEPTPTPTPKPKGDFPERSYESCREFPYETMEFVDESTYAYIKEAYNSFTFDGEFRSGDLALYEKYMEKYKELVNCDISFKVQQTGESAYLKEYGEFSVSKKGAFTPEELDYYVFDVNGDNTPELCVRTPSYSTYVFQYDENSEQIFLIMEMYYYEHFLGTGILYWNNFGLAGRDLNSVYHIDENGEVTAGVYFSEEAPNGEVTYLVSIPEYENEDKATEITQDMKAKAYYSEEDELYLFKVTESQYEQLTAAYTESWMRAEKEIETVAYTYDELFGIKIEGDNVSLERMDCSIVNDNGEKVGLIYYDKVVVQEDMEGAEKINSYFEKELEEWFDSSKNEQMNLFIEQTELMLERYDEETLVEYPTNYTVTTQITKLNTNIVSVLQIIHYSTGTSNWQYKGYTFDLQTGERLPLHSVAEIDADTLGQVIIDGVGTYPGDDMDMYAEMKNPNYTVEYWGKVIDMQYEYFVDDEFVYIILNEGIYPNDGVIMKWNGELGEKCETTLMNYIVENDGEIVKNIH